MKTTITTNGREVVSSLLFVALVVLCPLLTFLAVLSWPVAFLLHKRPLFTVRKNDELIVAV